MVCAALSGIAACGQPGEQPDPLAVSDSAGIEVVTVRPREAGPAYVAIPHLEIGVASGPEELELSGVAAALELPDGRFVVADGGTNELRLYDADGSFSSSLGGEGQGPGEFQSLDFVALTGTDTLAVYDARSLRLSFFDLGGGFLGSHAIADATLPYIVGSLGAGRLAAWQFHGPEPEGLGVHAATVQVGTIEPPGMAFRVAGTMRGAEEGQVQYRGRVTRAFRALSREGDVAAGGEHVYVLSSSADNRVEVRDAGGELLRVLAVDSPREAPTGADVEAWVESWMEAFPPPSQGVEDWWRFGFREIPPPDSIPLLRSLEVDAEGNVCAERYPKTWQAPTSYWCFGPDGRYLRSVEVRPGRSGRGPHPYWDAQLQIMTDRVVGVWADDVGVERVKVFRLEPGR